MRNEEGFYINGQNPIISLLELSWLEKMNLHFNVSGLMLDSKMREREGKLGNEKKGGKLQMCDLV